jgi:rubrerythrin
MKDPFIYLNGFTCFKCLAIAERALELPSPTGSLPNIGYYDGYDTAKKPPTTQPCPVCGHVAPAMIRRSKLRAYRKEVRETL